MSPTVKKLLTIASYLPPVALFLAAILSAPPSWRVAAFVAGLFFLLPAARQRLLVAYLALSAASALWLIYADDLALAFPLALLALILGALVPGKRYGAGDDYHPAPGVPR